MADIDYGTVAIIGICCALGVCLLALIIALIVFCRMRIKDDTNIRKRILGRQSVGGYAHEEVKTHIIEEAPAPRPIVVPAPVPIPVPERHYIRETLPALPAPQPPPQPEIVVHEVVHRYEPPPQPIVLPAPQPQQQQRMVRRSSWSAPHQHNDEWIMIKKKKKRGPKVREVVEDSDSSEDEEVITRHHRQGPYMMSSLNPYDLAIPAAYQRRPVAMAPVGVGMGMGQATYMVGARPMAQGVTYGVAPAAPMLVSTVPMMAPGGASTFQPTYGMVPRM